ncbi:dGTPase [Klebsiella pneumoniae]|uniref:dGTPase n=1 Tax=Klebsiella pneumoniae TaxID=573 RepID=UPI0029F4EA2D|nr:dGTPase [Klebsiella pneumoniae]MDX8061071.1 dGTPase [Klebsiella pneumoniae]
MKTLISTSRHRKSSAKHDTILASTQSDRARLIYSAAFRRLQQKAQVFSLESNSAVRSRLTHSIEVSHIGRYIVAAIIEKIAESSDIDNEIKEFWQKNSLSVSNIVETACLMHDIGNPPFGHFGEAAIVEWSKSDSVENALKTALAETFSKKICQNLLSDFIHFDGNPQGLRIITKLQGDDGYFGLNLTYTQLTAFIKYTFCPDELDSKKPFSKKIGYFSTEKDVMESAWNTLKMKKNSRHPLGFLMEASDDISYCISDIEDGIEKGIITVKHFSDFTCSRIEQLKINHKDFEIECDELISCLTNNNPVPVSNFLFFKTSLSNFLVKRVAEIFVKDYHQLIKQEREEEIISKGSFEYDLLDILKDYTSNYLFTSAEAECMELSGFAIIKGILDEYTSLIKLPKDKFLSLILKNNKKIRNNHLHIERRLFNRLPGKHLKSYSTAIVGIPYNHNDYSDDLFVEKFESISREKELSLRMHLIVDFVSGMTDQFSMEMYQLLKGIKVK